MKKSSRSIKKSRVKCNTPLALFLQFCNLASPAVTIRVSHKCIPKYLTYMKAHENKYRHTILKAQMVNETKNQNQKHKKPKTVPTFLHIVFSFISSGCCSVSYTKISLIACNYSIIAQ